VLAWRLDRIPRDQAIVALTRIRFSSRSGGSDRIDELRLGTHTHIQTQALNPDFFFFAYGIPIMLAICSRGTDAGLKIFAWLDGAQGLIAAMLAYLLLFSVLPSHTRPEAISATNLMYLNDAENWILVGAVTLRFFSNPSPARRRFYHVLSRYLWVNGIVSLWATSN
jgi:hypothetical protein